jgi:hypothetical protein
MRKRDRKRLLCATAACLLLVAYTNKKTYNPTYTIYNEEDGPFASYSDGYVYIGDKEYLNSLHDITSKDILVLDERDNKDPNMTILNSCNITDKEKRNEILEILCYYEEIYPTKWDRSIESMRLEWFAHNFSYYVNYKTNDAKSVDLNNEDETTYDYEVLRRLLRL